MNKFETIGCRLNQYYTQLIRENLENTYSDKNIAVINTCAVTQKATRESRNAIRKAIRNKNFVIVTGCYAKIGYEEIKKIYGVKIICADPYELINKLTSGRTIYYISKFDAHNKAFIKIQEGCNQFCSYCIVPYAKGEPKDRSIKEILIEVNNLIKNGYQEFILTGTNIGKCQNLLSIIKEIEKIGEVKRIGISSIEPIGITDELIEFCANSTKFNKYFHIPLQSGDNKILKLMNRWYTISDYANLIYKIKEKIKDVAIGADIIVGFPGEGDKEFTNTYNFIKEAPIDRLHIFRYSKRPMTYAYNMKNEPHSITKKYRSNELKKLSEYKWQKFIKKFIGRTMKIHKEKELYNGYSIGLTSNYIKVLFNNKNSCANFGNVKITNICNSIAFGELAQ